MAAKNIAAKILQLKGIWLPIFQLIILQLKKYLVANITFSSEEMSMGTKRDGAIAGNLFVSRKFVK